MPVKGFRLIIFGIHNHCINGNFFAYCQCSFDSVYKEHSADSLTLHGSAHCAAESHFAPLTFHLNPWVHDGT